MTILVLGATGATGRLLVERLLDRGEAVRAPVRSIQRVPASLRARGSLQLTEGTALDLDDVALARQLDGVRAVACCLGHNLTFRGLFGPPRRLVRDSVRRVGAAVRAGAPERPVRFVLMNSAGVRAPDERVSLAERCVLGLLRALLPPHADNEDAAAFLRDELGADDPSVAWCVLRPDGLHDAPEVTPWGLHPSPTRSAIFDAGRTSRINVADAMAALISDDDLWARWQGRSPVIYDED